MADDPKPDPAKGEPKPDPKPPTDPDLGDAGKKALDEERKARRDAEKLSNELKAKLQELTDRDKSETEKLAERAATAERRVVEAETRALRLEVAADHGLSPAQAKRLVGATREELEADANELLETFPKAAAPKADDPKPNVSRRPNPALSGGGDPTTEPEETDPAKLASAIRGGL